MKDFHKFMLNNGISSLNHYNYSKELINKSNNFFHYSEINDLNNYEDVIYKLLKYRIIFLLNDIDAKTCNIIKAQLLYLDSLNNDDIKIYIDSPGGEIYTSLGLIDIMETIKSDIETVNIGLAASMAAVLLACGSKGKRKSLKRGRIMIHQPLTYSKWVQQASDLEIQSKELNYLKKELYKILSDKTGQPVEKIKEDCERDYWMSAQDAKKYGLIDEIIIKK